MKLKLGITLVAVGCMSWLECSCEQSQSRPLLKAKVILVVPTESAWHCGSLGFSIIEFEDGEREKWCGKWGEPGDTFKARKIGAL